jgi:hypothetical protein
MMLIQW